MIIIAAQVPPSGFLTEEDKMKISAAAMGREAAVGGPPTRFFEEAYELKTGRCVCNESSMETVTYFIFFNCCLHKIYNKANIILASVATEALPPPSSLLLSSSSSIS